jgi:hypothetical protein
METLVIRGLSTEGTIVIVFTIFSHKSPGQVRRLAERVLIECPRAAVVIHHDARSAPLPAFRDPRIHVVDRPVSVGWGTIGPVEALLRAWEWMREHGIRYDWVVQLSGQDYPIARLADLEQQFERSGCDGFVDHALATAKFPDQNQTRYFFAYRPLPRVLHRVAARLWRLNTLQPWIRVFANRSGCFIGLPTRAPFDETLQCYRGEYWCVLSARAVSYVESYLADHPHVLEAYRRKLHPDESLVHSILASSRQFALANDCLRFISWTDPDSGSPDVLGPKHLDAMLASGKPFARKFEETPDASFLDLLDDLVIPKVNSIARSPETA